jgi:hypothetical protein
MQGQEQQELQGNRAAQFGVFGLVHHAHLAAAEVLYNAVVRDGLADQFDRNSILGTQP